MSGGGVGLAGIILTVPGLIDLCIKYGVFLKEKVTLYREIDAIKGLHSFVVGLVEGELHSLLLFFDSIDKLLTQTFRDELQRLFQVLRNTLERIKPAFDGKEAGMGVKLRFSFHEAKKLRKDCDDLDEWHNRFLRRAVVFLFFGTNSISDETGTMAAQNTDHTIARIKRIRQSMIDIDTEESPTKLKLKLNDIGFGAVWERLADSDLYILKDGSKGDSLAEYRKYTSNTDTNMINVTRHTVRHLAAVLREADPISMGILGCCGYAQEPLKNRFVLQFPFPAGGTNPRSLQNLLSDPDNKKKGLLHSMSDRINLAKKIASAVLYIHSCGFVHKNIRPDTIVIFEPAFSEGRAKRYPYIVGEPYLVGYDGIRKAEARSLLINEEQWERKIYLDPQRHDLKKGDDFIMRHDIYSLGVVLLEVACWSTFTNREGLGRYLFDEDRKLLSPNDLRKRFIEQAGKRIPPTLGNKYHDVVVSCLTGLAKEEEGHQLSDDDNEDIIMGTAYITHIMSKLEDISL